MGCKAASFIIPNPFNFSSFLYIVVFRLSSNISRIVFGSIHTRFCREFQALSFDKKSVSVKRIIEEKFQKYKQRNSLWDTRYFLKKTWYLFKYDYFSFEVLQLLPPPLSITDLSNHESKVFDTFP